MIRFKWGKRHFAVFGGLHAVLLVIFIVLSLSEELTASQAYDKIKGPLLFLIGGSLGSSVKLND